MTKYKSGITFGAFDPLHYGHVRLLANAKKQCELLIVAVSDDGYIRAHKGRGERFPLDDRIEALRELLPVGSIVVQSLDMNKERWVETLKPDVIFVGSDWTPETFAGEGLGVPVVYLPYTKNISSTGLIV